MTMIFLSILENFLFTDFRRLILFPDLFYLYCFVDRIIIFFHYIFTFSNAFSFLIYLGKHLLSAFYALHTVLDIGGSRMNRAQSTSLGNLRSHETQASTSEEHFDRSTQRPGHAQRRVLDQMEAQGWLLEEVTPELNLGQG